MTKPTGVAMDGFDKVRPITEGRVNKGGINTTSRITVRPPPPAPMRPAAPRVDAKPSTEPK